MLRPPRLNRPSPRGPGDPLTKGPVAPSPDSAFGARGLRIVRPSPHATECMSAAWCSRPRAKADACRGGRRREDKRPGRCRRSRSCSTTTAPPPDRLVWLAVPARQSLHAVRAWSQSIPDSRKRQAGRVTRCAVGGTKRGGRAGGRRNGTEPAPCSGLVDLFWRPVRSPNAYPESGANLPNALTSPDCQMSARSSVTGPACSNATRRRLLHDECPAPFPGVALPALPTGEPLPATRRHCGRSMAGL